MIKYSIQFMYPTTNNWYRERGLTRMIKRKIEYEIAARAAGKKVGDLEEVEQITTYYAGGVINFRGFSPTQEYDGWVEYKLPIMLREDWRELGYWINNLHTEDLLSYDEIIDQFESHYGKKIRWAEETTEVA